jgi:hypothetical protein
MSIEVTSRGFIGRALVKNVWNLGPVYDFKKIMKKINFDMERFNQKSCSNEILTYYDIGVIDIELQDGPLFLFIEGKKNTLNSLTRYRDIRKTMFVRVVEKYGLVPFSIISLDQYSIGAIGRLIDMEIKDACER